MDICDVKLSFLVICDGSQKSPLLETNFVM